MNIESKKVKELVPLVEVNTVAARDHVVMIKQHIRSVKERVRATTSEFPFAVIPVMMLIHIV